MKKSILKASLIALVLVSASLATNSAEAHTPKIENTVQILKIENMVLYTEPGNGSCDGSKKDDTPPKTEPTLWDKITDWWDKL